MSVGAIVALGLGTSLTASGVAGILFSRQLGDVDFQAAIEGLRASTQFTRSNQEMQITLRKTTTGIRIVAEHSFDLKPRFAGRKELPFTVYTDIGRSDFMGKGGTRTDPGGFSSISQPGGVELKGKELSKYVTYGVGKRIFTRTYLFDGRSKSSFRITTYANFRDADNLVWTIETLSNDLKVKVYDCTELAGGVEIWIKHHQNIPVPTSRTVSQCKLLEVDYGCTVLPYQGFELVWQFHRLDPEIEVDLDEKSNQTESPVSSDSERTA